MKRAIIEIDRDRCDGCGRCTTACAEGALELDAEGKAVLAKDIYCDGLGACLDVCPTGALRVTDKEAAAYDEGAALAHVRETRGGEAAAKVHGSASTSSLAPSELGHWPVQLQLASPAAPYFRECDLLVAADCTAFALLTRLAASVGSFHAELLRGKALVIACPKLDRTEGYVGKLAEIMAGNAIHSITVAIMEVPCCRGLSRIVAEAVERSGTSIAVKTVVIGIDGGVA